ncbi:MAG TPA: sigma-70 family RNA polymerase sigma factor [Thermoanaerobaculia bacterium]|nr:sigma-70 family RNA polymerase sigma factor [Thermoanaerobaculia bacterium]
MRSAVRQEADPQEFTALWQSHERELRQRCLAWTGGREQDAEEALSRTAMVSFSSYGGLAAELDNPRAWLLRLSYNICMDLHRARKRERIKAVEDLENLGDSGPAEPCGSARSPEESYLGAELLVFLRQSVRELPPRLRAPMSLHLFEEVGYKEISRRLAITEANVRKRIQHGREHLRRRVREYLSGAAGIPAPRVSASVEETAWDRESPEPLPGAESSAAGWRIAALRPVRCRLSSGLEKDLELFLHDPPRRATPQRIESLAAYIRQHPRGWKKRLELARLLRESGHLEPAVEEYRIVAERGAIAPPIWIELGTVLRDLGRREEAVAVFEKAARTSPDDTTRHYFEGLSAVCRECWPEAARSFRRAAEAPPGHLVSAVTLGRFCLRIGRIGESIEALEQALAIDSNDPVALLSSHDALMAADRPLAARERIRRAAEIDEFGGPALTRLVAHRCAAGEVEGAEGLATRHLLEQLRRFGAGQADADAVAARYKLARGDWKGAEASLAHKVASHPRHPRYRLHYARLLLCTGARDRAAREIFAALALDPEDREICRTAWESLSRAGEPGGAGKELLETLRRYPDDWLLVTAAATAFLRGGDAAEADRLSLRAVELQPGLPASWFLRGRTLGRQKRAAEAIPFFERGWALLPPGDGFALSTRAARQIAGTWARRGDAQRAQLWYRTALEHAASLALTEPARALAERGRALEGLGETAGAVLAYRTALTRGLLHPGRARVLAALRRLAAPAAGISQDPAA